jgi:hypothetical protein
MPLTKEIIEQLAEPFGPEDIEYVRKGGGELAYVSYPAVVQRLDAVVPGEWSFTFKEAHWTADYVSVVCDLTVAGCTRSQAGGMSAKRDQGDALKGAMSYALRKAASLFQVGLHLWTNPPRKGQRPPQQQRPRQEPKRQRTQQQPEKALPHHVAMMLARVESNIGWGRNKVSQALQKKLNKPISEMSQDEADRAVDYLTHLAERQQAEKAPPISGGGRPMATERQIDCLGAIAQSIGWSKDRLRQECSDRYGCGSDGLSRSDASDFISDLQTVAAQKSGA